MTGAELATILRQEYPDLPVVMATGYAEMPAGAAPRTIKLSKPFRQQDLQDVIQAAMQRQAAAPA
jgi:FixJ family two-component response regulator